MADEKSDNPEVETDAPKTIGEAMGNLDNASIMDVELDVVAVLGVAELKVSQVLQLGRGAVVELERGVGEPIDLLAKGRAVATGEVIVVEEMLAVKITEIIKRWIINKVS
jgi:flagellar motor switch protein FliN/FliY